MEVITFQLIIIVTVALTFLIVGRKSAFILGIFWSLWTAVLLFHPPLILTQLGFTWGTYLICRQLSRSRQKLRELTASTSEYDSDLRARILAASEASKVEIIAGHQHFEELRKAITTARDEVIILSGWISSNVLDDQMLELIERRIGTGVVFFFGYGWQNATGNHSGLETTDAVIHKLNALALKYPSKIYVKNFPNHEKLLIKDREYLICGSNNWLSNRRFRNSERSVKVLSAQLATTEAKRIKEIVHQNASEKI